MASDNELAELFQWEQEEELPQSNVKVSWVSMKPDAPYNKPKKTFPQTQPIAGKTAAGCLCASCFLGVILGISLLVPLGVI